MYTNKWLDRWIDSEPPHGGVGLPSGIVLARQLQKQNYHCALCTSPLLGSARAFWGQPDKHSYAVLLCKKCNSSSGYRAYYKDPLPLEEENA